MIFKPSEIEQSNNRSLAIMWWEDLHSEDARTRSIAKHDLLNASLLMMGTEQGEEWDLLHGIAERVIYPEVFRGW